MSNLPDTWVPNLAGGVALWQLAADLNAPQWMNGALLVPVAYGPANLPTKVDWDLTDLSPLPNPPGPAHAAAFAAFAASAARTAAAMQDPASPFYAFRDAFELPTLAAKCHFVDDASGAIRISQWGARPHRHGAVQQWVQHASTIRDASATPHKSAPPTANKAATAKTAPTGATTARTPLLAGAGICVVALLAWSYVQQRTPPPPTVVAPVATSTPSAAPTAISDRDQDGVADAEDTCPDVAGPASAAAATPAASGDATQEPGCPRASADVAVLGRKLLVADSVHFALGNAKLTAAGDKVVQAVGAYLAEHPEIGQLEIIGHADPTGNADSNFVLSTARALSVRQALLKVGVADARVIVDAAGAGAAIAANTGDDAAAHAKARRAEFWIAASAGRRLGPNEVR